MSHLPADAVFCCTSLARSVRHNTMSHLTAAGCAGHVSDALAPAPSAAARHGLGLAHVSNISICVRIISVCYFSCTCLCVINASSCSFVFFCEQRTQRKVSVVRPNSPYVSPSAIGPVASIVIDASCCSYTCLCNNNNNNNDNNSIILRSR